MVPFRDLGFEAMPLGGAFSAPEAADLQTL